MSKASPQIIVKNYEHYNRAMGKYIRSKKHYEYEMKKGGYIPFTEAKSKQMEWVPSADLKKTLGELKVNSHKGKINVEDKLIDKMQSMGMNFNPKFIPKDTDGGFDNAI